MICLQNYDIFNDICLLDASSGKFEIISKHLWRNKIPKTNGFYTFFSQEILAIYSYSKNLYLFVNNREILVDENIKLNLLENEDKTEISLTGLHDGDVSFEYQLKRKGEIDRDLTPFIDDDSFDFALFIANIVRNEARKEVFIEVNS